MKKRKILKAIGVTFSCIILVGCKSQTKEVQEQPKEEIRIISQKSEPEEEEEMIEEVVEKDDVEKKHMLIAIDPGHQSSKMDMSAMEPNAPGSDVMKMKATGGTTGSYSGSFEYQLNLDIALAVRDRLISYGYDVIMTRENNETAISNMERATMANEAGADFSVRIHANGSEDPGANGALMLIGSSENPYVGHLYNESYLLAESILNSYCSTTGMQNLGIQVNDTMTGINWSQIPVVILEMGFMTNEQDDLNMADTAYREKMVDGIVNGINAYVESTVKTEEMDSLGAKIREMLSAEEAKGTVASVYIENLDTNETLSVKNQPLESASLIKLFVAGTVYEHLEEMQFQELKANETTELIRQMIAASDNTATNTLVTRLGQGSAEKGMELVNQYCSQHGFGDTHMGRLMLDFEAVDDNYTSVADCGKFLSAVYRKEISGADEILSYMMQQERTGKIPAGVPEEIQTANKTGELENVENDVAIIYGEQGAYSLCVMLNHLPNVVEGQTLITDISSQVYGWMTATE